MLRLRASCDPRLRQKGGGRDSRRCRHQIALLQLRFAVDHLRFRHRLRVLTVASLRASASRRDCSICFCFSGKVCCMASACAFASMTTIAARLRLPLFRGLSARQPPAPRSAPFFFHFQLNVMRSFSCSLISKPSMPFRVFGRKLDVAQHHFADDDAVGARRVAMRAAAAGGFRRGAWRITRWTR